VFSASEMAGDDRPLKTTSPRSSRAVQPLRRNSLEFQRATLRGSPRARQTPTLKFTKRFRNITRVGILDWIATQWQPDV
jgi:hypothetical protein